MEVLILLSVMLMISDDKSARFMGWALLIVGLFASTI